MFEWLKRFWHRHRTKLLVTGAVVGGAVLLGKYASWKLNELRDKEAIEYLALTRRQHHFDSNQRTCNMTVMSMIPSVREKLMELLNSEALTAQLKTKPNNKLDIWDQLKIVSFTRTIVAVYSSCMLVVMLRIQLNIIGGYMYLDSLQAHSSNADKQRAPQEVQQRYLATIQHLLEKGLQDLIRCVRTSVEAVLNCVSLKQCITLQEVEATIGRIRSLVESEKASEFDDMHSLCKYMLPTEDTDMEGNPMLRQLYLETKDMLESQDCHKVLSLCLDTGFSRLSDSIAEFYKPADSSNGINFHHVTLPLAKVIPVMNGQIHSICSDAPNHFIQDLLLMQRVKDFAANVYEAFSQEEANPVMAP
ncbi:peroxisomal biogenesis factor 3-like [Glandiceps talaboti]